MEVNKKTLISKIKRKSNVGCASKNKILSGNIRLFKRIGEKSKNGEVIKGCILGKDVSRSRKSHDVKEACNYDVAVKKIPLMDDEYELRKNPETLKTLNSSTLFSELYFLKIVNSLISQNICMNLPLFFSYFICNNCTFKNDAVYKYYPGVTKCVYVVSELADYVLTKWLSDKSRTKQEMLSAYLQIYMGLYCIKKYFNIRHHDLHSDNVLVKTVKPGGYWKYKVEGKDILIPNYGFIFILWDFGYSRIPGKLEPENMKWLYKKEPDLFDDYVRIIEMAEKMGGYIEAEKNGQLMTRHIGSVVYEEIIGIISKSSTHHDIIQKLSSKINKPSGKLIATFDTTKKLNTKGLNLF